MAVKVAVLGFSRQGLSMALALAGQNSDIRLAGWDADLDLRTAADRLKIFNPVCKRAQDAVKDASLVILALPEDDLQVMLDELSSYLEKEVVVVAVTHMHAAAHRLVRETLGEQTPFISIYPALDAADMESTETGADAARADIFEDFPVFIADAQDMPPAMLDLAVDLAVLLGGRPVFTSPQELDGLISANVLLQQLAAAALMNATAGQPSWREGKVIAGRALRHATLPLEDLIERERFGLAAVSNRETMEILLVNLIRRLLQMRDELKAGSAEKTSAQLEEAVLEREKWLAERRNAGKPAEIATSFPGKKEALARFLALGK